MEKKKKEKTAVRREQKMSGRGSIFFVCEKREKRVCFALSTIGTRHVDDGNSIQERINDACNTVVI
jgi:hypothetical protein